MISERDEKAKARKAADDRERRRDREEAKQLIEIAAKIIDQRLDETDISPSWVATEAMRAVGGFSVRKDKPLLYRAGHLEFRQIARGLCRDAWESDDDEGSEQHELFPGLQKRYPIAKQKGEEPVYRLLEHLTHEDRLYNIKRLRAEASKKLAHADALEAYDRQIGDGATLAS